MFKGTVQTWIEENKSQESQQPYFDINAGQTYGLNVNTQLCSTPLFER